MDTVMDFLGQISDSHIVLQFLGVFAVAAIPFLEGYVAAPLGVVVGLSLAISLIGSVLGNWLSVMVVVLAGNRLQAALERRKKRSSRGTAKRMERARQLFGKYGVPGVALIGPLLIGNHIGAFISVVAGADRRYVVIWQTVSIVLWTVGAGLLAYFGVGLVRN